MRSRIYFIVVIIITTVLTSLSCSKLSLSSAFVYEYHWLYTVTFPGFDTLWPMNNSYNINSAHFYQDYQDYKNNFHFYINGELIGVKHYTEVYNDISGADASFPGDYDSYYNNGNTDDFFKMMQWYAPFNPPTDKALYSVIDFPINYTTPGYPDTVHYAIFELTTKFE